MFCVVCSWLETNTPHYYSECVRVVGPLMEQGLEKAKTAAVFISENTTQFILWVKEKTPQAIEWVRLWMNRCFLLNKSDLTTMSYIVDSCLTSVYLLPRWTPTLQTVCSRCWHIQRRSSSPSITTTSCQRWRTYPNCYNEHGPTYRNPASQYLFTWL